jgi:hypothetical protein
MQRLAGLPTTPDITLLDLRKPKPHPRSHTNTTFRELTYIRWCCIDLSNAPRLEVTYLYAASILDTRRFS